MKYLFLILLLIIEACNYSNYPRFDYNYSKNPWINAFKDEVFFSALKEAYISDSMIFLQIQKRDVLNPYDGLSLGESLEAERLGKELIKNIPPPMMCENCLAGMNYYMAVSLHYYGSEDLDNIAKKYFKLHIKNRKLVGLEK